LAFSFGNDPFFQKTALSVSRKASPSKKTPYPRHECDKKAKTWLIRVSNGVTFRKNSVSVSRKASLSKKTPYSCREKLPQAKRCLIRVANATKKQKLDLFEFRMPHKIKKNDSSGFRIVFRFISPCSNDHIDSSILGCMGSVYLCLAFFKKRLLILI